MPIKYPALLAFALLNTAAALAGAESSATLTCSTWTAERSQPNPRKHQVEIWLDGYLSGLTVGSGTDFESMMDGSTSYLRMDDYCRSNPTNNASDFGVYLVNEELKKKHLYKHQF